MSQLVIVHLGSELPSIVSDCVRQFQLFNHIPVRVLTGNEVPKSSRREKFNQASTLDRNFRGGFWHAAAERFLVIYDYMKHENLSDVIHIEYDNLVYMDVSKILSVLQKHYTIAIPTDCPGRVIPSFMYFKNVDAIEHLVDFMVENVSQFPDEMRLLKAYMDVHPERMKGLPIAPKIPGYSNHLDEFQCLFDAAALGQYVGGVDPRNIPGNTEGFVNESCIFRADKAGFEWKNGQPWAFGFPVVNLHIHCKNLKKWALFKQ